MFFKDKDYKDNILILLWEIIRKKEDYLKCVCKAFYRMVTELVINGNIFFEL